MSIPKIENHMVQGFPDVDRQELLETSRHALSIAEFKARALGEIHGLIVDKRVEFDRIVGDSDILKFAEAYFDLLAASADADCEVLQIEVDILSDDRGGVF